MICVLDFIFLNMAFSTLIIGCLINIFETRLPEFISQSYRYGKFAYTGKPIKAITSTEVPKSYFKHFYVLATLMSVYSLITTVRLYFYNIPVSGMLISFLDLWCGRNRQPTVSIAATLIALSLMTIQCARRFYETFFIQVFAKSSKINLTHYIVGHFHYFGCFICILSQSVGFTSMEDITKRSFIDVQTVVLAVPAICVFYFAWKNQLESNKILANLRKDEKSNKVVSQKYHLPKGGLFKYVSCPHLFCEILIYLSLTTLMYKNFTWLCIVAWVLSNQIETALLSHWWYQKTFPKMPKDRKALIPFLL